MIKKIIKQVVSTVIIVLLFYVCGNMVMCILDNSVKDTSVESSTDKPKISTRAPFPESAYDPNWRIKLPDAGEVSDSIDDMKFCFEFYLW